MTVKKVLIFIAIVFVLENTFAQITDTGDKVGVGTSAPKTKLDVNGAVKASRLGYYGTYNPAQAQGIWSIDERFPIDPVNNTFGTQYGIGYAYHTASGAPFDHQHQIVFTNKGTVYAAISLAGSAYFGGKVGIGIKNPTSQFHLKGAGIGNMTFGPLTTSSSYYGVSFYGSILDAAGYNISSSPADQNLYINRPSNKDIKFRENNTDQLILLAGGNVGIGTTTPTAKLEVVGSGKVSGGLAVGGDLTVGRLINGGFGALTTAGVLDWNDVSNTKSGSGYSLLRGNATNGPDNTGNYYHPFNFEYSKRDGSGNMTQLAIPYGYQKSINEGIKMRGRYSGNWTPWVKIISENTAGNVGIGTTSPTVKLDIVASPSGGEIMLKTQVEDAPSDYFTVGNATGSTNQFIPALYGFHSSDNRQALVIYGGIDAANDLGTTAIMTFDARLKTAAVAVRPLFTWDAYGDTKMSMAANGNVGIGTINPLSKLAVNGSIRAKEVRVLADISVPDYVFAEDYQLRTLSETRDYIKENKHLPEIPSAAEIAVDGFDLGEMNMHLLKKVEELTLYQIQLLEALEAQQKRIEKLEKKN